MKFGDMYVTQNANRYVITNAYGFTVCVVILPFDCQWMYDAKVVSNLAAIFSARWKPVERCAEGKPASGGYYGFVVLQVGESSYAIYRPDNGQQIAIANFPPNNLLDDHKALRLICKLLAMRYNLKA